MEKKETDEWFIYHDLYDSTVRERILSCFTDEIQKSHHVELMAFDAVKEKWLIKLTKNLI